jgi:oligopeptide/dipeptide ABC transporter ATP-binding protein
VLALRNVSKRFVRRLDAVEKIARALGADVSEQTVHAVDNVSLEVGEGEVVGLVGESGCGKSTLGRVACGLHEPSEGQVLFKGKPVALGPGIQMIFQDPFASLNPRMRVEEIVGEAPRVHGFVSKRDVSEYVADLLNKVGLDPSLRRRYPHQFSGGQRARIGIARALAVKPDFLVCDEPVAALDVSIQAQVLNLFMALREKLKLTYLFISHDLGVVRHMAGRVVVMYLGRVVESGTAEEMFAKPSHPYTQALLAELPRLERRRRSFEPIKGEIPSSIAPPSGCHFHPRCPHAMPRCREAAPPLIEIAPGRVSACHLNTTP